MCAPRYKKTEPDASGDGACECRRGLLHDDVVDGFAESGVSCDVLDAWKATATRALPHRSGASSETLPVQGRDVVVRFLCHLVATAGLETSSWFDAVLLFDAYRVCGCVSLEVIPAACSAVVSLLVKQSTAACGAKMETFALEASQLARWLHSAGIPSVAEVHARDVRAQEHAIVAALNWRLNLTPVNAWLGAFRKRFCIVTNGRVGPAIDWVVEKSTFSAGVFLHSTSSCGSLSPQEMANGLFCLGLVEARLLPLDAMRLDEFSPTDWEGIFASNTELQSAAKQCALPPQHLSHMLDTLEVATSCTVSRLRRDTYAVALAMGHAVVERD
eukprot:TRINITY_DN50057_c0_g1_i1.p1 TRINITY_DN50057_c0_g1~~TRINITY_DN50057_c0_g1_i1.p1  ORF type:complete len:330 (+),score=42.72 TRINITY_DN50057_c0_g1_i1:145-1134(+)